MRKATTTLVLTTALLGWTPAPAGAQDKPAAESTSADAAEEAFLKAYFAEKELKDYAAAEKAYAAIVTTSGASHEVVARSTLGRARCLAQLKRLDESAALFAKVEKDFADVADAAKEARDARQASAMSAVLTGNTPEGLIRADIDMPTWRNDVWKYGERGVPTLIALLKDESPERVYRAAESLARMETPIAHEALAGALEARSSTYPEQVRNAAESDYVSISALRRLADVKDAGVRAHALSRLVYTFSDAQAIEKVAADAALRASYIAKESQNETYGRVLVAALARGGDARDAALARLRGDALAVESVGAFLDPPAPVLADAEALALIAPPVEFWFRFSPNRRPSPALVAAFLRHPTTAKTGVSLTMSRNAPSADPDAFVDAVARVGFGKLEEAAPQDLLNVVAKFADALVAALGPNPKPETLRRLAAGWPNYIDWPREEGRLPNFLRKLMASGVVDEASLLAFQDGLAPQSSTLQRQFVASLSEARRAGVPIGAWATKAFLRALERPTDSDVAAAGLQQWHEVFGDASGVAAHLPQVIAALGNGGSDHLVGILEKIGKPAVDALRAALPTHPDKGAVVEALAQLGDKSSADAVARVLADALEIEDADKRHEQVAVAATALITLSGDAAKDALAAALVAHDGRDAPALLESLARNFGEPSVFGPRPRFELCKLALEKCPGQLRDCSDAARELPPEMARALAIAALGASSVKDRRWGASEEKDLLDAAAWDALLAAAQDSDNDLRDTAREALRAIRAKENEMAEFRAMGEERTTRLRIESLLRPKAGEPRPDRRIRVRAGVAAIAATNLAGMVNELIRLAAEDEDDDVREDARKALLAMAKTSVPTAQPTQSPAEKK